MKKNGLRLIKEVHVQSYIHLITPVLLLNKCYILECGVHSKPNGSFALITWSLQFTFDMWYSKNLEYFEMMDVWDETGIHVHPITDCLIEYQLNPLLSLKKTVFSKSF